MRIFEFRTFRKDRQKLGLDDRRLLQAARELIDGKFDAMLGGGLFKQRVARPGGGKSGGARALLAFREGERIVFIEVFAKNAMSNISAKALAASREVASIVLTLDDDAVARLLVSGQWLELVDDERE